MLLQVLKGSTIPRGPLVDACLVDLAHVPLTAQEVASLTHCSCFGALVQPTPSVSGMSSRRLSLDEMLVCFRDGTCSSFRVVSRAGIDESTPKTPLSVPVCLREATVGEAPSVPCRYGWRSKSLAEVGVVNIVCGLSSEDAFSVTPIRRPEDLKSLVQCTNLVVSTGIYPSNPAN